MSWKPDRYGGLRRLLWGARVEEEVDEEFAHHVASLIADLMAAGASESEARAEALRRFGDVSRLKRETVSIDESVLREERRAEHLSVFARETRYAFRALWRSPAFAVAAILTLGLGIGALTSVYTLLDAVVLRPLPYAEADRLVTVTSRVQLIGDEARWGLSEAGYHHFRAHSQTLSELAVTGNAFQPDLEVTVTAGAGAERVRSAVVSPSAFTVLRIEPLYGRAFEDADSRRGAPNVVILGYDYWQRRFDGAPVLGRTIEIAALAHEIVGVMPRGVHLPDERVDVWLPVSLDPEMEALNAHWVAAVGRLVPGATAADAAAELDAMTRRFGELFPAPYAYGGAFMEQSGFRTEVTPLHDEVVGGISGTLWLLLAAVAVVLLIAGANVANLFLVRFETRRREVALRAALGARHWDLAWHHLGESVLIGIGAVVVALLLALGALDIMERVAPPHFPRLGDIGLTTGAIWVTILIGALSAVAFGVIPLVHSDAGSALARKMASALLAGPRRRAARSWLVVVQTALALVLLVAGGLMLASVHRLRSVQPGFEPAHALTLQVAIPFVRYSTWSDVTGFHREATERIAALPGVTAAGALTRPPMTRLGCATLFTEERLPAGGRATSCVPIMNASPDAFAALGVRLAGEPSRWSEVLAGRGGVVVTQTLAERLWPGQDAIGKGIRGHGTGGAFYRVAAVAEPIRYSALDEPPQEIVFFPFHPIPDADLWGVPLMATLIVRGDGRHPHTLVEPIRRTLAELDANVPLAHVRTLEEVVARSPSMARASFTMLLLLVAGGVALLLSTIGIYGVIAYLVAQRTGEIGLRIALGAGIEQVKRAVLRQSLMPVAAGLAAGVVIALAGIGVLRPLLFDVSPRDARVFAMAVTVLVLVAAAASYMPARRAARVDPMTVLRTD